MFDKIKKEFFCGWNLFEISWLSLFLLIQIFVLYNFPDSLIGVIVAISGLLCVVFVGKGKISNYLFGLIFAYLYAYTSFQSKLYGEMLLALCVYVPAQFIGYFNWKENLNIANDNEVIVKSLSFTQLLVVGIIAIVGTAAFIHFLVKIESLLPGLDGTTVTLVIIAQILMVLRYKEQWVLWIVVNVISITLWSKTYYISKENWVIPILIMMVMYLLNSLYGFYNWNKLAKKSK